MIIDALSTICCQLSINCRRSPPDAQPRSHPSQNRRNTAHLAKAMGAKQEEGATVSPPGHISQPPAKPPMRQCHGGENRRNCCTIGVAKPRLRKNHVLPKVPQCNEDLLIHSDGPCPNHISKHCLCKSHPLQKPKGGNTRNCCTIGLAKPGGRQSLATPLPVA